jgi:hypothetical protein
VNPSDISVLFGKPMTEEEFAAYRHARGEQSVRVLSAKKR